jgi:GNAT superfamily N-acetyltransferase
MRDRGYTIRRSAEGDGEAIAREFAAYLAHIGVALDSLGLDHDIAEWWSEYDGVSGVLLVLEAHDGTVVGTAGVRSLAPGVGELKRMWIRPEHQGHGLGRRLLDASLAEARGLGCRLIRLDTQKGMEAARHLYRAAGFREIPDYNGNPRAQVWLERTL